MAEEGRVQTRVVVTRAACDAGDNVTLALLVDELEVMTAVAAVESLGVSLHLPQFLEAAARIEPPEPGEELSASSGVVSAEFAQTAAGGSRVRLAVSATDLLMKTEDAPCSSSSVPVT